MRSPRHRWNWVAMQTGQPYQADRLSGMTVPDKIATELKRVAEGKGKTKAYQKALAIYQADSARIIYETLLFATLSVEQTAKILKERQDHLQIYADCFFDISVFETEGERIIYLDRLQGFDPDVAAILRNAMSKTVEDLAYLADRASGERVQPKDAIDAILTHYTHMFKALSTPQLENVLVANPDPAQKALQDEQWRKSIVAADMSMKAARMLLEFELDKTADSFLEAFVMALTPQPPAALIEAKPSKDAPPDQQII